MQVIDFLDKHGGSIGLAVCLVLFVLSLFTSRIKELFFEIPLAAIKRRRIKEAKARIALLRELDGDPYKTMIEFVRIVAVWLSRGATISIAIWLALVWPMWVHISSPVARMIGFSVMAVFPVVSFLQFIAFSLTIVWKLADDLKDIEGALRRYAKITGDWTDEIPF
jgi:hypothetical protein